MTSRQSSRNEYENRFDQAVKLRLAGEVDEAVDILEDLLKTWENPPLGLYGYLGLVYMVDLEQDKKAAPMFRHILSVKPSSEKASIYLFQALWHMGEKDQAIDELERFLSNYECGEEYSVLLEENNLTLEDLDITSPPKQTK